MEFYSCYAPSPFLLAALFEIIVNRFRFSSLVLRHRQSEDVEHYASRTEWNRNVRLRRANVAFVSAETVDGSNPRFATNDLSDR